VHDAVLRLPLLLTLWVGVAVADEFFRLWLERRRVLARDELLVDADDRLRLLERFGVYSVSDDSSSLGSIGCTDSPSRRE
jgi:hypothetical protein